MPTVKSSPVQQKRFTLKIHTSIDKPAVPIAPAFSNGYRVIYTSAISAVTYLTLRVTRLCTGRAIKG